MHHTRGGEVWRDQGEYEGTGSCNPPPRRPPPPASHHTYTCTRFGASKAQPTHACCGQAGLAMRTPQSLALYAPLTVFIGGLGPGMVLLNDKLHRLTPVVRMAEEEWTGGGGGRRGGGGCATAGEGAQAVMCGCVCVGGGKAGPISPGVPRRPPPQPRPELPRSWCAAACRRALLPPLPTQRPRRMSPAPLARCPDPAPLRAHHPGRPPPKCCSLPSTFQTHPREPPGDRLHLSTRAELYLKNLLARQLPHCQDLPRHTAFTVVRASTVVRPFVGRAAVSGAPLLSLLAGFGASACVLLPFVPPPCTHLDGWQQLGEHLLDILLLEVRGQPAHQHDLRPGRLCRPGCLGRLDCSSHHRSLGAGRGWVGGFGVWVCVGGECYVVNNGCWEC